MGEEALECLNRLWGGLLGALELLELLALLLTAVEYGPRESRNVLEEAKSVIVPALPRLCCTGF